MRIIGDPICHINVFTFYRASLRDVAIRSSHIRYSNGTEGLNSRKLRVSRSLEEEDDEEGDGDDDDEEGDKLV